MIILCFNPLPHAEGDSAAWKKPATWLCFNPLPHAEGDMARAVVYGITGVSIHSLTQRETALPPYSFPASCVSIHSLTQRETASRLTYPVEVNGFNPLPHAEGDHV